MTSPLRRKRPTTVPAPITAAPTALSLAGLLLVAGLASAQTQLPTFLPPIPPVGARSGDSATAGVPTPAPANTPPIAACSPDHATTKAPAKPRKAKPHDQFAAEQALVLPVQAYGQTVPESAASEYQYLVQPPGPEALYKLESESEFFVRLGQEWRDQGHKDRLVFPTEPIVSNEVYLGRAWPGYALTVEPNYVNYGRLLFEQPNYERYGWDLGVLDPPLSAGKFFLDVALLPYHAFTDPFRHFESSAGYCLPGDPVPLLLYPPECSLSGAMAEAASVLGTLAVFP
jgi:hypothetical protein